MLIIGDLSGIQGFLFDVRESGGKQAASLRFRSLRLQLIAECIARRVLWALDLSEPNHLLYCAAGKFAIESTAADLIEQRLETIRAEVECWLLEHTHGRLRCAIAADNSPGIAVERNDAANAALQRRKLRPWAGASWESRSLVVLATFDLKSENEVDAKLGRRLLDGNVQTIRLSDRPEGDSDSLVGVSVQFSDRSPAPAGKGQSTIALDRIARHTPRGADGRLVEFVELAERSRGAAMLGILKADADSLGAAIRNRLGNSPTFQPLKEFSQKLDGFFGATLHREMSAPGLPWNNIYTVFAGGDDLLLVGPWDIIIDFASHIRKLFMREFKSDGLTISASCAVVKPKFPLHLAARQAKELLEQAKTGTKDQFASFGDVWKWDDHAKIIEAGKQLANWADAGDIQRGWLHTLLELALLQRHQANPRDPRLIPAMASSRLAYHVARNWPKTGSARQWIDHILKDFDHFPNISDPTSLHLPAIIRYAMLATRSPSDKE